MALQDAQAEQSAFSQQYDAQQATQKAQEQESKQPPSFMSQFTAGVGRVTTNTLDWAVSAADSINNVRDRAARDVGAGAITGATNTADAVGSALASSGRGLAAAEDPAHADEVLNEPSLPTSPIWDHAKGAILDFRDAVAVKDPTLSDNLLQGVAQLAIPFTGYSRALSGVHGFANLVAANALTDATALGPHDPRMADLISMGRQVEGKFGDALRTLAPDGSALNAYINFLGDRGTGRGELSDLQAAQGSEGTDPSTWGKREDGTDKGRGWLGLMRRPDGQVSSELSVSSDINGKETLFPLLVPGLSKDQVQQVLAATPEEAMKIPGVMQAASEFAKQRIAAGKSPFAGQDESPTYESDASGRFKNVLDGFGVSLASPLLHAVGSTLKYGTAGLRYAIENGVGSAGDLMPSNQAGHIAFHGTRADIPPEEGFSNDKLLTGEGTNAFGAGHYFAENPETAGTYARRSVPPAVRDAQSAVKAAGGDTQRAYKNMMADASVEQDPDLRQRMQQAAKVIRSGNHNQGAGNLYSVDIPDTHVTKMIDWDAPLSEQPQNVQDVFHSHGIDEANMTGGDAYKLLSTRLAKSIMGAGDSLYFKGDMGDKAASALLHMRGVPGIRFLDSGSRGSGEGTRNLVLFNGKDAKITGKNGKSIAGQERQNMSLSKEERAAERERVAALRDREEGVARGVQPEPIPRRAAEHEGEVARRMKEK